MFSRIADIKDKQVVCVKSGKFLGYPNDVELDFKDGRVLSLVVLGKPRFFGLLGRGEDIVIPWNEISVIGQETILVDLDVRY